MIPTAQFTAKLRFHFREHDPNRPHWFMFDESCHRRVPMRMDGVDSLNTVGLWTEAPCTFKPGDSAEVRCRVIAPELFIDVVQAGRRFELWDGGFFASGVVLARIEDGWRE